MRKYDDVIDGGMDDSLSDISLPTIVQDPNIGKVICTHNKARRALGNFDIKFFPLSRNILERVQNELSEEGDEGGEHLSMRSEISLESMKEVNK